jgi:ribonuclease/clavin/mitogillin
VEFSMLKWKRIMDNLISIDVGRESNGEVHYWTTLYYYKGVVIDTGCPHTAEETAGFLEKMRFDIKAVLLSHFHEDHCGGAYSFRKKFNVNVFAPSKSIKLIRNPPEIPQYRQIVWGQPKPVEVKPLKRKMKFGQLTITTVETPGHSFDHVSFLIENKLFMGDLITNQNPIIIMRQEDYIDLINSLRRVLSLEFAAAYGGHGVWDKGSITKTLNNILKLKEKVTTLTLKGLGTEQIAERIFSNAPKRVLLMEKLSGFEWSRKNLVDSLLGCMHKEPEKK